MKNEQLNMQMKEQNELLAPLQKLNLMDDFLFDVTTVNLEACRIIIELSLGIRIKEIRWKEGQKVVHNVPGKRGIRMDFYVEDADGSELYENGREGSPDPGRWEKRRQELSQIQKKLEKGKTVEEIADELEAEVPVIERLIREVSRSE